MKKILVIVLCLSCVTAFAQKKKKKATAKRATTTQQAANKPATPAPMAVDTTKKQQVAAGPAKPFDRPVDGYFKKSNILNAKVTPYATVRESDAAYVKYVWREVDTREKMNQFLSSPKGRLIDVIMDAVAAGELTAYDPTSTTIDPDGDGFTKPLTPAQAKATMQDSVLVDKFDPKTGDKIGSSMQLGDFVADSVVKFRIKEEWIFDRQRSTFEPRIIGIAPMKKIKVTGVNLDYQPAFWIYFPDARPIFATKEAVNRHNDNTGLSYDDIFMKRLFASYITKESNDKNLRIKDYAQGMDRLYESERVKKEMQDWELNLWSY
ncbi:MAG TPA: gliding motility protein GldN [Mucilaginibacter sp.]|jgi:gliding motility associated protien GldN|nr:gliding motility protein GldN [Mucilaginibacter sp.]